jgi:hypothetical protein
MALLHLHLLNFKKKVSPKKNFSLPFIPEEAHPGPRLGPPPKKNTQKTQLSCTAVPVLSPQT